ncbi:MAG: hypothetical protein AAF518_27890 [Spirochaetota bacterium]
MFWSLDYPGALKSFFFALCLGTLGSAFFGLHRGLVSSLIISVGGTEPFTKSIVLNSIRNPLLILSLAIGIHRGIQFGTDFKAAHHIEPSKILYEIFGILELVIEGGLVFFVTFGHFFLAILFILLLFVLVYYGLKHLSKTLHSIFVNLSIGLFFGLIGTFSGGFQADFINKEFFVIYLLFLSLRFPFYLYHLFSCIWRNTLTNNPYLLDSCIYFSLPIRKALIQQAVQDFTTGKQLLLSYEQTYKPINMNFFPLCQS